MISRYNSLDLSELLMQNANIADVVSARINESARNRKDKRRILKALGKVQKRDEAFNARQAVETKLLRSEYQKELDSRIADCKTQVDEGLTDNWKKLVALDALTLKRKYNWSNGRIEAFVEKSVQLHRDLMESGEWDSILHLLDEECDIQLEVED